MPEEIAGFDPSAFVLDFATSDVEKARRDVKSMVCSECFLYVPIALFEKDGDVCAECRGV